MAFFRCYMYLVFCFCLWHVCALVSTQSIFITNNATAEKGEDVQLTCQLGLAPGSWPSDVTIRRSENPISVSEPVTFVAVCQEAGNCLYLKRYTLINDRYNVYINITQLDRSEDEKFWACINVNTHVEMFLTVYTTPASAILTSSFTDFHMLSEASASLICRTDRCTYKDPTFRWFFILLNGSQQEFKLGNIFSWSSDQACNDSEKIYYCQLTLQQNLTFSDNSDISVQFVCGIIFPTLVDALESPPTGNVSFAVQINSVHLYDDNQEMLTGNVTTVIENVSHSVTCKPGPARPPPINMFYLGRNKMSESTNSTFTFIPNINDHDDEIYCKAYNLQEPENAVVSNKLRIYVAIPITSVTLYNGNQMPDIYVYIHTTEGSPKTLTCDSSESIPLPIFAWYIDDNVYQNHSDNLFTFIPQMNDHNKHVYCKAYNLPGIKAVESWKPTLYVTGRPVEPLTFIFTGSTGANTKFYWIAGFDGGSRQSFVLQYKKSEANEWINITQFTDIRKGADETLPEFFAHISNLTAGDYQARLIARNRQGESAPVYVRGSTFEIHVPQVWCDTALSAKSSTSAVITIGATLGVVILLLLGLIIWRLVPFGKRKDEKGVTTTDITLEEMTNTQAPLGSIHVYEELQANNQTPRYTYATLE